MTIPQLDVFQKLETQTDVERDVITDHRPISVLSSKSHIDFEINLPQDEYMLFNETYLYIRMKVRCKKINGSAADDGDWETIIPSQYLLNTMFRQINVQIGNVQVTPSTGNFMYKSYIEAMLGYTYDARTAHLSAALWNDKENAEEERNAYLRKGKEFEMMGRLHLDLTHQERGIIGGTKISIRLYTNPIKFMFKYGSGLEVDYDIVDTNLEVHRMGISEAIRKLHRDKLEKNCFAHYPFTRSEVKNIVISTGSMDVWLDNIFTGLLPRRIFFSLVNNEAYNGHSEKDPFNFEHFKLCFFACQIDGKQYPPNGLTPDFEKGLCVREYMSLMRALNQNSTDSICNMSLEDYKDNRIVIGINFAPDLSNGVNIEGKINPDKTGSLRIKLKFAEALKQQVTAMIYAEFRSAIDIDGDGNAITTYM